MGDAVGQDRPAHPGGMLGSTQEENPEQLSVAADCPGQMPRASKKLHSFLAAATSAADTME